MKGLKGGGKRFLESSVEEFRVLAANRKEKKVQQDKDSQDFCRGSLSELDPFPSILTHKDERSKEREKGTGRDVQLDAVVRETHLFAFLFLFRHPMRHRPGDGSHSASLPRDKKEGKM